MENTNNPKSKPPTFRFKNIGPVKDAEMELGDLTIIAGRNNTGKTYIVYTLYGFLRTWIRWYSAPQLMLEMENQIDDFRGIPWITEKVSREGRAGFPLNNKQFRQGQRVVIQELARSYSTGELAEAFSDHEDYFKGFSMQAELSGEPANSTLSVEDEIYQGVSLAVEYDGSSVVVTTDAKNNLGHLEDLEMYITHLFILLLLQDQLPEPFILSAERFGISLFYRELDFTKNQLVNLLQKLGEDKNRDRVSPYHFIERTTSRYALPIKDNIDYTRDIPYLRERRSEIFENKLFDDIKKMMDGYYSSSGEAIRFISKSRKQESKFNIPLHLASSSVRGLTDLYFYLKHVAEKNHLLIVDEPESHLDTANQILLARLLARCVRAGLKVLISTHSDYIIKEINNLVMLSSPFKDKEAVVKKLKYSPDDFINPDAIRAYVAENNSLTRCDVDRFGIDMPVFDETIDRINSVANDLASRMSENSEE